MSKKDQIIEEIRKIYDPELPVNIYELGLIYDINVESEKFVTSVGKIAENEGHHPDISFGWGYAKIKISTHAIKGLAESDFILAAKIDKI